MKLKLLLLILPFLSLQAYAKTFVFLHGGPGFNSEPERNILKPYLENLGHRIYFWDEPSILRPEGRPFIPATAFQNALNSAEFFLDEVCKQELKIEANCKVDVISHSFGVHAAVNLAQKKSEVIERIILSSPTLNIESGEANILKIALAGLKNQGSIETAEKLEVLLPQVKELFDGVKAQAFILANEYKQLFFNYWVDYQKMGQYFSYLAGAYQFDPQGFFAVRMSMPLVAKELENKIAIPTVVYFGANDPVVDSDSELTFLKNYFSDLTVTKLNDSKHYSHIEKKEDITW